MNFFFYKANNELRMDMYKTVSQILLLSIFYIKRDVLKLIKNDNIILSIYHHLND